MHGIKRYYTVKNKKIAMPKHTENALTARKILNKAEAHYLKAFCLIDLGHHLPNTNIEMIVSRLADMKKLGGFHFNDSKYGDDDLDSGSINPFALFLIFNELTNAKKNKKLNSVSYMIDQSHNITDPIESLIMSAIEIQRAFAKSLNKL